MVGDGVVIVGAGHAGGQAAAVLRAKGYGGTIRLLGEEPHAPYERPPLSKALLAGEIEPARTYLRKSEFYGEKNIDLRIGIRVEAIEREARRVVLAGDEALGYEKLILATGSVNRQLDIPGVELAGVRYLRSLDESLALRSDLEDAGEVVVVGGGYIGLEVAATARKMGAHVTVLEMLDRIMARVVAPEMSDYVAACHRDQGVEIRTGVAVTGFEGDERLSAVRLSDDSTLPADFAVVGVGVVPNDGLAAACGLEVENGIVVDEFTQTSDPDIFAIGDVTNHPNGHYRRRLRLENVQNAMDQAKAAALAICGTPEAYSEVPWFWSDQFDLKIQIAGLTEGADQVVVRQVTDENRFAVAYLKAGVLIALDAINAPKDFMQARKLIPTNAQPDLAKLADPAVALRDTV
jgi:3-phenylpropionate/trans-cinnamate dioxygenase ferredoxin reductase subunit